MHTLHMHPQSKYQKSLAVKWWGSSKHKWKLTPKFWPTRQQHNNPFWNNLIKWHPKQPYCTTKCLYFFVKNELVLYITILLLNTQDIVHHCIKISGKKTARLQTILRYRLLYFAHKPWKCWNYDQETISSRCPCYCNNPALPKSSCRSVWTHGYSTLPPLLHFLIQVKLPCSISAIEMVGWLHESNTYFK